MDIELLSTLSDILSITVRTAAPITLGALACTFSERAGVVNIGIEGIMMLAAFFAVYGSYVSGNPWVGVLFALIAGGLMGLILAVLSIYCDGHQVVIGIGFNLFGPGLATFLNEIVFNNRGTSGFVTGLEPVHISGLAEVPILGAIFSDHNVTVYLCWLIIAAMSFVLFRSRYGLRIRAVGENPKAVETVGLDVYRLRMSAVVIGGMLAGLAGASLSLGTMNMFTNTITDGRGFLAYAANRFGQWLPMGSYAASLLFGFIEALRIRIFSYMGKIPPQLMQVMPYLVTLLALWATAKTSRAPAATGKSYPHSLTMPASKRSRLKKRSVAEQAVKQ